MKRHASTGWFFALAAAVVIASVLGVAAGHALAAPPNDKDKAKHHKVKAKIKHRTLVVKGSREDDQIVLRLRAGDPATLEVVSQGRVVGHKLRRDRFDAILVQARDGNDSVSIDESGGVFTDTETTTVDGDEGNDTLLGGRGNETFDGGPGDDSVDGNQGADFAFLGEGDDSFTWDNGDGSDVVEGQDGFDTMVFNGAGLGESFDASANGQRLRFTRNLGNIVMDVDGTEHVDLRTLGGADSTTVNDLSATDVIEVSIDLAAAIGGNAGDGALACKPDLLIADEPTTALDVTIQAQILDLLRALQHDLGMSILLITHDLGVVAETCDEVCVMYAGRIVERASTDVLFTAPRHHYTAGLLRSVPSYGQGEDMPEDVAARGRLVEIKGMVPSLLELPKGCKFVDRCPAAQDRCRAEEPALVQLGASLVRCHFPLEPKEDA